LTDRRDRATEERYVSAKLWTIEDLKRFLGYETTEAAVDAV
jgi:hypothetical protein